MINLSYHLSFGNATFAGFEKTKFENIVKRY
nr:MAG TPA: hypothetical protein [Caudoviricetes sp.]